MIDIHTTTIIIIAVTITIGIIAMDMDLHGIGTAGLPELPGMFLISTGFPMNPGRLWKKMDLPVGKFPARP